MLRLPETLLLCGAVTVALASSQLARADLRAPQKRAAHVGYVVQRGDTLLGLAKKHQVSVKDLQLWNELSGEALYAGQSLFLRSPQARARATPRAVAKNTDVAPNATADAKPKTSVATRHDEPDVSSDRDADTLRAMLLRITAPEEFDVPHDSNPPARDKIARIPSSESHSDDADLSHVRELDGEDSKVSVHARAVDDLVNWDEPVEKLAATVQSLQQLASNTIASLHDNDARSRTEHSSATSGAREASVASVAPPPPPPPRRPDVMYTVRRRENARSIARAHGLSVKELSALNPAINVQMLRSGQTISIGPARLPTKYIVERGETVADIASRFGMTEIELRELNGGMRSARQSRVGAELRVLAREETSLSLSIGGTNNGTLQWPNSLGPHPGYAIRTPERAYGTSETVQWIADAASHVHRRYGASKRVWVHDISDADGGQLREHKSHQSGRDADVSYYQRSCPNGMCAFQKVKPRELDTTRIWAMLHYWLSRDQVEMIFIDYPLQKPLYAHAKRAGATKDELEKWFQYPHRRSESIGKIRHFDGHDDHFHVRFVCPQSDGSCR